MTWRTSLLAVALAAATVSAQSPLLTDAELEPALAAAKEQRFQSLFVEARGRFGADFSLLLQGPIGRTMDLAREAFASYKPFGPGDVAPHVASNPREYARRTVSSWQPMYSATSNAVNSRIKLLRSPTLR